jgi:hypothetical protein
MTKAHKTKAIKAIEQACGIKVAPTRNVVNFRYDTFGPMIYDAIRSSDDLDDLEFALRAEVDYATWALDAIRKINQAI